MIETVGVVGLGLIGGSMAKAIRQYTDCTILGYDTDGAVLSRALDEGVVSAALTADRLAECGLVVIALSPRQRWSMSRPTGTISGRAARSWTAAA